MLKPVIQYPNSLIMMEININLLSEEKRNRIKRLTYYLNTKNILSLLVIVLAIVGIVLLWGTTVLIDGFKNLSESTNLINREYTRYNTETKEINKTIHDFNNTAANWRPVSGLIVELANQSPADIKISSLSIDINNKKIEIIGIAKTRAALLDYQKNLEKIPWVGPIDIPAKQLFEKTDINFDFDTTLK